MDINDQHKLKQLMEVEGFDSVLDMLEEAVYSGDCYGICTNSHCDYTIPIEPDSTSGHCEKCNTRTVKSCLALASVI